MKVSPVELGVPVVAAVRTGSSEAVSVDAEACMIDMPATMVAANMPVVAATVAIVWFLFMPQLWTCEGKVKVPEG